MASLINNDVIGIVLKLLFKDRTMKGCKKYKDTYERSKTIDGATLIKHTFYYAFNYRTSNEIDVIWNYSNSTKRGGPTNTNYKLPKNY